MKVISVEFKDLERFGHTAHGDDKGNLVIYSSVELANLEELFIRACLKDAGEEYDIIETNDWFQYNDDGEIDWDNVDIQFVTNYPWKDYLEYFEKLRNKKSN